jgi:hypothetical protein
MSEATDFRMVPAQSVETIGFLSRSDFIRYAQRTLQRGHKRLPATFGVASEI